MYDLDEVLEFCKELPNTDVTHLSMKYRIAECDIYEYYNFLVNRLKNPEAVTLNDDDMTEEDRDIIYFIAEANHFNYYD